jgi:hypothetical protein
MRGVPLTTVRALLLVTALVVLANTFAACGGSAAVTVAPGPTPTRTPLPEE